MSILKCVLCVSILLLRIFSALNSLNNEKSFFFISHSLLPIMHFPLQNFYIQNIFSTYHETSGNNKMCLVQKSQRHKKWHIWGFFRIYTKKEYKYHVYVPPFIVLFTLFIFFFLIFLVISISLPPVTHILIIIIALTLLTILLCCIPFMNWNDLYIFA